MKKQAYYTTEELAAATEKLLQAGRPMTDIANDPKCPPDVALKMQRLKALSVPAKPKGGLQ